MRHLALFNGIGGFQLAAAWMGWGNVASVEINPFCNRVTKYHFPNCTQHEDIRTTDFTIYRGNIDIITGGFPCQPFSVAGERKGTDDDRYLWPEMLRCIREVQPTYIVGENVNGIVSWNNGMVFEQVCADLENEGYEVHPVILPACAGDAPHRRDRVWFIAYRTDAGIKRMRQEWKDEVYRLTSVTHAGRSGRGFTESRESAKLAAQASEEWIIADTKGIEDNGGRQGGFYAEPTGPDVKGASAHTSHLRYEQPGGTRERRSGLENNHSRIATHTSGSGWAQNDSNQQPTNTAQDFPDWRNFPTQSPVCGGNDGIPGRLDGITVPSWRRKSMKAYGNAIIPQVAYQIFTALAA